MSCTPRWLAIAAALAAAFTVPASAEDVPTDLAGYYDGGQMEVGAGLELSPDGRFRYEMSYGAIDEGAEGTWTATDAGIVLHSDPVTAPAFELVSSKKGNGSTFDLTLDTPQGMSPQYFSAVLLSAEGKGASENFGESGLHIDLTRGQAVAGVVLQLPIFDVASPKFDVPPGTGAMTFRFVPNDLGKVAFADTLLLREGGAFLMERYDRLLKFRKQEPDQEDAPYVPPKLEEILPLVTGPWTYAGQDCDPDNHFDPPADTVDANFELSPDYTYRLTRQGKEEHGSFTIVPSGYFNGEAFLVKLDAGLTFIFNIDRLESWDEEGVRPEQCTQLFDRPGKAGEGQSDEEQPEE